MPQRDRPHGAERHHAEADVPQHVEVGGRGTRRRREHRDDAEDDDPHDQRRNEQLKHPQPRPASIPVGFHGDTV